MDDANNNKVCDEYEYELPQKCNHGMRFQNEPWPFTNTNDYYEHFTGGLKLKNIKTSLEEFRFTSNCKGKEEETNLPTSLPISVGDYESGIFGNEAFSTHWLLVDFECS